MKSVTPADASLVLDVAAKVDLFRYHLVARVPSRGTGFGLVLIKSAMTPRIPNLPDQLLLDADAHVNWVLIQ